MKSSSKNQKIRNLAKIRAGYQARKGVDTNPSGSHMLIQIRDFNQERTEIDMENIVRIAPGKINKEQEIQKGDVIFLAKGAKNFCFNPADLGQPALAASYFFILRPVPELDPSYLTWFLNLETTINLLRQYATQGAHMPIVRRDVLEDLEIPLPDLETQRKIVELSNLADQQSQLLSQLAEKKRSLATAACLRVANQSNSNLK